MITSLLEWMGYVPADMYLDNQSRLLEEVERLERELRELRRELNVGWHKSAFGYGEVARIATKIVAEELEAAKLKRTCEARVDNEGNVTFSFRPLSDVLYNAE